MQLKIYKLSELAELEWIHYQTALQRAKSGKYVAVTFSVRQRTKSVEMTRYLSKADSDIILAAFNQLEAKKDEDRTSQGSWPIHNEPPRKRKLKKNNKKVL